MSGLGNGSTVQPGQDHAFIPTDDTDLTLDLSQCLGHGSYPTSSTDADLMEMILHETLGSTQPQSQNPSIDFSFSNYPPPEPDVSQPPDFDVCDWFRASFGLDAFPRETLGITSDESPDFLTIPVTGNADDGFNYGAGQEGMDASSSALASDIGQPIRSLSSIPSIFIPSSSEWTSESNNTHSLRSSSFQGTPVDGSLNPIQFVMERQPPKPTPEVSREQGRGIRKPIMLSSPAMSVAKRKRARNGPGDEHPTKRPSHLSGSKQSDGYMTLGQRDHFRRNLTQEERKNVAAVKAAGGSCYRCKRLKIQCVRNGPYEPCESCKAQKKSYKVPRMPCFKDRISVALLYRKCPLRDSPLCQKREAVFDLNDFTQRSGSIRKLQIAHKGSVSFEVHADVFILLPEDKVSYSWISTKGKIELGMPNYCLTDIDRVKENIKRHAEQAYREKTYLKELPSTHPIIALTVNKAMEYASTHEDSIVAQALRLWSSTRLVEGQRSISGNDTLGLAVVPDRESHLFGIVPIVPIMDTQIDQIIIQEILEPLRCGVLGKLQKMVEEHKPDNFFEVYLTTFILLSSIERNTIAQASFAKRHRFGQRFSNPKLLERYFHAANILVSHFRFVCHGFAAIQSDWDDPGTAKLANLRPDQAQFVEETKRLVNESGIDLTGLRQRNEYETALYWCHQLFFPGWTAAESLQVKDRLPCDGGLTLTPTSSTT